MYRRRTRRRWDWIEDDRKSYHRRRWWGERWWLWDDVARQVWDPWWCNKNGRKNGKSMKECLLCLKMWRDYWTKKGGARTTRFVNVMCVSYDYPKPNKYFIIIPFVPISLWNKGKNNKFIAWKLLLFLSKKHWIIVSYLSLSLQNKIIYFFDSSIVFLPFVSYLRHDEWCICPKIWIIVTNGGCTTHLSNNKKMCGSSFLCLISS